MTCCWSIKFLVSRLILCLTILYKCDAVTIDANLNMNGVKGTISFSQASPTDPTEITVSLTGLDQYPSETFPWHIHNYPFTTQCDDPCSAASVGGHFDPFMARSILDYSTRCSNNQSLCEVGDMSGKFGRFNASAIVTVTLTDNNLSLYGVHSIMGRSVVIHHNNDAHWVCANIEYPSDVTVGYSPFRTDLIGNIFFIEPFLPMNLTSVFVQLSYISEPVNSSMHGWHVYNNSIDGDCVDAGEHYSPRDISVLSNDYKYCSSSNQTACQVGDLAGKSSSLSFNNGHSMLFYTDTNLPVRINRLNESILGRSVVIHEESPNPAGIACANLLEYTPRIATAKFQEDGVTGQIVFKQLSPFSPTVVRIQFNGLLSRADDYHVHEFPVDETIQGGSKCMAAGGHYNPTNIMRNSSSPNNTLDAYEIGDLSGKSSLILTGVNSLDYSYTDPYLPLFGTNSIVGRSVVIHKVNGDRWLCANIIYDMDTVSITTVISNDTFQGRLVLTQLANDPFSETIILLDFNFGPPVTSTSINTAVATPITTQSSTSTASTVSSSNSSKSVNSMSIMKTSSVSTMSTVLVTPSPTQPLTSLTNFSTESLPTSSLVSSSITSMLTTVLPTSNSTPMVTVTNTIQVITTTKATSQPTSLMTTTPVIIPTTSKIINSTINVSSTNNNTMMSTKTANRSSTSPIASTTSSVTVTSSTNRNSTSPIASTTSSTTVTSRSSTSSIASTTSSITVTFSANRSSTSPIASTTSTVIVTSSANRSSTSPTTSTVTVTSSANRGSTSPIASTTSSVTVTSSANRSSTSPIASTTSTVTVTSSANRSSTSPIASTTSTVTVTSNANRSSTSPIASITSTVTMTSSANRSSTSPTTSTVTVTSSANRNSTSPIASTTSSVIVTSSANRSSTSPIASTTSTVTVTSSANRSSTSPIASTTSTVTVTSRISTSPITSTASPSTVTSSSFITSTASSSTVTSRTSTSPITSTASSSTVTSRSSTSPITSTASTKSDNMMVSSKTDIGSSSLSMKISSTEKLSAASSSITTSSTTTSTNPATSNTATTNNVSITSTTSEVISMGIGSSMPSPSPTGKPDGQKKKDVSEREAQMPAIYLSIQNNCESGSSDVGHDSASSSCSPTNPLACPIGDLVGKHGPLSSGRNLLTDLNLPLTGPNSVAGMAVAVRIGDADSPIAGCVSLPTPVLPSRTTSTATTSKSLTSVTASGSTTPEAHDKGKKTTKIIIIASGTGGGVILCFIIAFIICYIRRCRRRGGSSDFVSHRSSTKGYEPLQMELEKKEKSKSKKNKTSEDNVEL